MPSAPVLFAFGLVACAPSQVAPPPARSLPGGELPAGGHVVALTPLMASCRAVPSTVYGSEPVVFDLGASPAGPVELELLDRDGRSLARDLATAPGSWRPPELPSGDFSLQIGPGHVACWVTVNRELSRASDPLR